MCSMYAWQKEKGEFFFLFSILWIIGLTAIMILLSVGKKWFMRLNDEVKLRVYKENLF